MHEGDNGMLYRSLLELLRTKSWSGAPQIARTITMSVLFPGGCRCDAVHFEITEVFDAGYCHCNRCRNLSGAPVPRPRL